MQRLTVTIPLAGYVPGDAFDVFANADGAGRALAAVDFSRSCIGGRRPFYPLIPVGSEAPESVAAPQAQTVEVYCGSYRLAVRTYDHLGNVSTGTPVEFNVPVNSGPRPASYFLQTAVAADGRPVFAFVAPEQLE